MGSQNHLVYNPIHQVPLFATVLQIVVYTWNVSFTWCTSNRCRHSLTKTLLAQVFFQQQFQSLYIQLALQVIITIIIASCFITVSLHPIAISSGYARIDHDTTDTGTRNATSERVIKAWFLPRSAENKACVLDGNCQIQILWVVK